MLSPTIRDAIKEQRIGSEVLGWKHDLTVKATCSAIGQPAQSLYTATGLLRDSRKTGAVIERTAQRAYEFLSCLAARIRALCAFEENACPSRSFGAPSLK
jgi:hypothetical protein